MFASLKLARIPIKRFSSYSSLIDINPEVKAALKNNKPVVALESTIITHGMPNPQNLDTAIQVEEIIWEQGVVPATIGVIDGRVKVGLDRNELTKLANPATKKVKVSRRDFPYVISKELCGGTTVSGTIMIAKMMGINIFVTGGIGGVHKNGENTMDISADLKELGMNSIMTVCSGVKSILDIEKTLEYLETEGVCVARYGEGGHFPAFYSEESLVPTPYQVQTPQEAAGLLKAMLKLEMSSGIILAVPVPNEFSIDYETMEKYISQALEKTKRDGISGKEITPYVLNEIYKNTKGKSLDANIALIKNNALVGAKVAKEYYQMTYGSSARQPKVVLEKKRPVIVGGSNVDNILRLTSDLKMDGRTVGGRASQAAGGVGRNLADALGKLLPARPLLVSAVGGDSNADFVLRSVAHLDTRGIARLPGERTASYTVVVDEAGETRLGVGDMQIHQCISPDMVTKWRREVEGSSLLVLDGNIPSATIEMALQIAAQHHLFAWFEPTNVTEAGKPFLTPLWEHLSFVSPNLNELREMAKTIGITLSEDLCLDDKDKLVEQVKYLASPLAVKIPIVMVTMGPHGLMMVSRAEKQEAVMSCVGRPSGKVHIRYYRPLHVPSIENTSGAGDCTAAGFVAAVLEGKEEAKCVQAGLEAGQAALLSSKPVPESFKKTACSPISSNSHC